MDATLIAKRASVVALGLMAWAGLADAAMGTDDDRVSYSWSAELIEFDAENSMATVRARIVSRDGAEGLEDVAEGERLMLTWSGITRAAGIRSLSADLNVESDRMSMPVEFIALSDDGVYVDFRVPVPASDRERISELEPGRWITATAIRPAETWHDGVTQMRAFTDVS